jgi:rod shape-determining protein MreD
VLLILLVAALLPLLAPAAWLRDGAFPHAGVLVVVYVALQAGPAPAAWCGVILGFLGCPWTAAPLGETSFLLGSAGFVTGAIRQAIYRDRAGVQIALVAAAVVFVRLTSEAFAGGSPAVLAAVPAALLSAVATALAAPPVFGLLGAVRVFRRRWRGTVRV